MECCRNYDVIENVVFNVSEVKKTNNVPDNFNKFERSFIICGSNIKNKTKQCATDGVPIVHLA